MTTAKVVPFFITYDRFMEPGEWKEGQGWAYVDDGKGEPQNDEDGMSMGAWRESTVSTKDHELGYLSFDDDGVLYAMGTTTMKFCQTNGYGDQLEGAYLADRHHMHDAGAVHTWFFNRVTGEILGEIFC